MFKSLKHSLGKWKRNFFDERTYDDLIEDGWEMTGDGFWVKEEGHLNNKWEVEVEDVEQPIELSNKALYEWIEQLNQKIERLQEEMIHLQNQTYKLTELLKEK